MNLHDRVMGEAAQPDKAWIGSAVATARKTAMKRWGAGWQLLSMEQQHAFVAREVLSTIAGQAKSMWQDDEFKATLVHLAKAGLSG